MLPCALPYKIIRTLVIGSALDSQQSYDIPTHANRPKQGLICPVYNASKAAVIQLARNLAAEWGQYNIRVNTLSPGYILTSMLEMLFIEYPERREQFGKENMLGRLSRPREYRGAAVFLLSDASSFMTGSDLRIDGGHAAWWTTKLLLL